ncbi:MAG TPA: choice-of-anchor Q domain-containing protein, partial [Promineifilum sp.]|nr:choice-of-anchor Q domain-containing protein [Promineifilum sp.]
VDNEAYFEYLAEGGGIQASVLTLTDSVVAGNTADGGVDTGGHGGGIHMGSGAISGSTISGNEAEPGVDGGIQGYPQPGKGGGVMATGAVTIVNSTFSDNEANEGGGLFVLGETTLIHSTLSGNNARTDTGGPNGQYQTVGGKGGGVLVAAESSTCGALTASGNLISGNTAAEPGRELLAAQDQCAAAVTTDAFNVFGRGGDSGTAGFTPGPSGVVPTGGLSAILSPAAGNGGPTPNLSPPAGSPALDLAPNASCVAAPVDGVDQRGEPRGANGAGGASANECDAGSFELQTGGGAGAFLVSPSGSGTVGGVSFSPADILKYDPATGWSMFFDGSDVGITKNLSAFEVLDNGHILMSFAASQPVPGVGTFAPQDIARFIPTATGESTAGSFQWQLDGSAHELTTGGEKIDALADDGGGRFALSTVGSATVTRPEGGKLKAQDEDALGYNFDQQRWSALFDGTAISGLRAEDVNAMWIDPATGDIYIGLAGAFNLSGVKGNGRDIVKLTPSGALGGYTPSLWWDGSAAGFPVNIDGLEILR